MVTGFGIQLTKFVLNCFSQMIGDVVTGFRAGRMREADGALRFQAYISVFSGRTANL